MERPVFLISSERSGSTLLRVILDSHPRICAPSPPHLLAVFPQLLHLYGSLEDEESFRRLAADVLEVLGNQYGKWESSPSVDELLQHCRERSFAGLFNALYSSEARRRGKKRYFVKDNGGSQHIFFINAGFPDATFIYLVRDVRDVVASWLESPPHFGGSAHAAEVWSREQEEALQAYSVLGTGGRMHLVHYEDLVGNTEKTLKSICRFLGEEYSPRLLDYHRTEEAEASAAAIAAWKNVASPIMKDRVGRYGESLSHEQVRKVEEVARTGMELLGYTPSVPLRGGRSSFLAMMAVNPSLEALKRFFQLLTGRASRREIGRRVARHGALKEVERRARTPRRPWSSPGERG